LKNAKIYKKLYWLNELPTEEAEYVLLECCDSHEWARLVAADRPFAMIEPLFDRAEQIFLSTVEERAAFPMSWPEVEQGLARLLER